MDKILLILVVLTGACLATLEARNLQLPNEFSRVIDTECRKLGEECKGFPKCCSTLHCYREEGIQIDTLYGECVTCIDRTLVCQRDEQCCDNLKCQKDSRLDVNGICDINRKSGEKCYKDEQCESGECDENFFHTSGTCE